MAPMDEHQATEKSSPPQDANATRDNESPTKDDSASPNQLLHDATRLDVENGANQFVRVAILFEGLILVAAWLIGDVVERPALSAFEWDWLAAGWGVVAALPMFTMLVFGMKLPFAPIQRLKEFSEEVLAPMFARSSWTELLIVAALAGIGEEMLFRGIMQHALTTAVGSPWGIWLGLAVGSVTFGLAHAVSRTYAFLAGAIGLYLGCLLLLTGNLITPIVAHAVYDLGAFYYLLRGRTFAKATPRE